MRARRASTAGTRRAVTYLEIQVAFAVLGIILAGLAPLVAAQLRLATHVERHVYCLVPRGIVPEDDGFGTVMIDLADADVPSPGKRWARRLGVATVGMSLIHVEVTNLPKEKEKRLAIRDASGGEWWTLELGRDADGMRNLWDPDRRAPLGGEDVHPSTRFSGVSITPAQDQGDPASATVVFKP